MSRNFSFRAAASLLLASFLWAGQAQANHGSANAGEDTDQHEVTQQEYRAGIKNAQSATVAVLGAIATSRPGYDLPANIGDALHGTGFHYHDGYIVTARHSISDLWRGQIVFRKNIKIMLENMEEYPATLVGANETLDIAVYKIDLSQMKSPLGTLKFGSRDPVIGDRLYIYGFPDGAEKARGYGGGTIHFGQAGNEKVYLPKTADSRLMHVDINTCLGNSGGAVFNERGDVVGVMQSFVQTHVNGNEKQCGRMGMAIPGTLAVYAADAIIAGGNVQFPVMGVKLDAGRLRDEWKVVATKVYGAAEKAGMLKGDFILAVDDTPVKTTTQLQSYLLEKKHPGDEVKVKISRDGVEKTLTFALGFGL